MAEGIKEMPLGFFTDLNHGDKGGDSPSNRL